VQAGVVRGDNWLNLDENGEPSDFFSTQLIVTHKFHLARHRYLEAIEPLGRISYGDPNTAAAHDDGWLVTPGLALYFTGRNKIAVNMDIWAPGKGDTETSLKVQTYLHF
jgi:hypothetical protein